MRAGCNNNCTRGEEDILSDLRRRTQQIDFLKLGGIIFASACAWYLGSLLAYVIPEESLISTYNSLQNIAERPKIKAPPPKRLKCDHWVSCSPGTYAYRMRSGGGKNNLPKICFEDSLLMSDEAGNVGRGINIAVVDYDTGNVIATETFDMWEGEFSAPMASFIRKTPERSLLLMMSHDDGSSRLREDGKKAIAELGSKEIWNLRFRSSWVFIAAKGFKLPEDIEKEKINHSDKSNNRYSGWPAEVQIEGCIPKNLPS